MSPGKMKKHTLFALTCSFVLLTASCAPNTASSFQDLAESTLYHKAVLTTDKSCSIELDLNDLSNLCNTQVFDGEEGKIILSAAEFVQPDTLELHFEAHGTMGQDLATIITACAYDESFLQSTISTVPSEDIHTLYSLQTTEFETYGNQFSVSVFFSNNSHTQLETLQLTFSDLLLIAFTEKA